MKARYRWPLIGLASLVALLVALHLALPWATTMGHVADVDLAWWRGAYRINGLRIVKTSAAAVPLLDARLSTCRSVGTR